MSKTLYTFNLYNILWKVLGYSFNTFVMVLSLMMADTDPEEKKLVNKVITIFFVHKKYSRSFITLQLNHWCHMDVFNDVFTTFLGLKYFSSVAVYGGSESSRDFIKNIVIYVLNMNKCFKGYDMGVSN